MTGEVFSLNLFSPSLLKLTWKQRWNTQSSKWKHNANIKVWTTISPYWTNKHWEYYRYAAKDTDVKTQVNSNSRYKIYISDSWVFCSGSGSLWIPQPCQISSGNPSSTPPHVMSQICSFKLNLKQILFNTNDYIKVDIAIVSYIWSDSVYVSLVKFAFVILPPFHVAEARCFYHLTITS